ncbi:hypothetical protein EDC96DRAFT_563730 [Choanephora cucurbitarum]|nr:hypothetical protein EDC96DRAFT_563730 [Choanephora cucurbitarum]
MTKARKSLFSFLPLRVERSFSFVVVRTQDPYYLFVSHKIKLHSILIGTKLQNPVLIQGNVRKFIADEIRDIQSNQISSDFHELEYSSMLFYLSIHSLKMSWLKRLSACLKSYLFLLKGIQLAISTSDSTVFLLILQQKHVL